MATRKQAIKLAYAAMSLALALLLPFITGQIPEIGKMLCPMHIPILLCGFLCGWKWGMAVGHIAPLLRSVLFGMPAMFPGAIAMSFELAAYGAVSGLVYCLLRRRIWAIFVALFSSMAFGRIVWGIVRLILAGLSGNSFTWALFIAGAFTQAIPGIVLQIALIPGLVMALDQNKLTLYPKEGGQSHENIVS